MLAAPRQQGTLQATGQFELVPQALLRDEVMGHARTVDRERRRRRDRTQYFGIGSREGAAVAPVDDLDRADRTRGGHQRRAQQRLGHETAVLVAGTPERGVPRRIRDDLRHAGRDRAPDDALPGREPKPGEVDRPDAHAAFEHAPLVVEQEQRGGFGLHEVRDARDRFGESTPQVERHRQ
ncbi:MAG: hypothetical protein U1F23_11275 [Lysobacterales bacterium]